MLQNSVNSVYLRGMVVRMRVTRAHRDNRRSHHALKEPRLSKCSNCGGYHLRHRVCPDCGYYRGKLVVDVVAKKEKKMQKQLSDSKITKKASDDSPEKETKTKTAKKETSKKNTAKKKTTKSKKDKKDD